MPAAWRISRGAAGSRNGDEAVAAAAIGGKTAVETTVWRRHQVILIIFIHLEAKTVILSERHCIYNGRLILFDFDLRNNS